MQKRIIIYGALAFTVIIAVGFKINRMKKEIRRISESSCEINIIQQLNLNDLANHLNFGACKTKWVAIHLTNESSVMKVRILK